MDSIDKRIINGLQGGFPLSQRPYRDAALALGISEEELISRIGRLLDEGVITRFGPMYNADKFGGEITLAAMQVPEVLLDQVAAEVNNYQEVAHNYHRDHEFNLWFVIATDSPERLQQVIADIERRTGFPVYNMPKEKEFFVGLRFEVA